MGWLAGALGGLRRSACPCDHVQNGQNFGLPEKATIEYSSESVCECVCACVCVCFCTITQKLIDLET